MSTTIESLELQVQSSATSAVGGIDVLTASLSKLKNATKGGVGLTSVTNQLKNLNIALQDLNLSANEKLTKLSESLKGFSNLKISSSIGNQLKNIGSAATALNTTDFKGLKELGNALKSFNNLGKINLTTFTNNFPKLAQAMDSLDINDLTNKFRGLSNILAPLAASMNLLNTSFNGLPANMKMLINSTNQVVAANNKHATSWANLAAKTTAALFVLRRASRVISSCITRSNQYIESMNLFSVSMGDHAEEAKKYADAAAEIVGIDPAEWMNNQGIFMTIADGFGVASDRAHIMSQNLTQLGYDLSSFYNLPIEETMQKVRSGLSGELEPLRNLGYDLSVARLQQEAYTLGIKKKVSVMTQAEKSELRYYAIMTQVNQAQGDMARTMNAPANQLRILKAQVEQCARSIGNLFLPVLRAVLPSLIALAKVIRVVIDLFAKLFNVEIPSLDDAKDVVGGIGEAADGLGDAAKKAKKLKNALLGIDELNIISPPEDNAGSGDGDLGGGGGLGFDLPTYDFLKDAVDTEINKIVAKMKEWLGITDEIDTWAELFDTRLGKILELVGAIGLGLAAWKISKGLLAFIDRLSTIGGTGNGFGGLGILMLVSDLDEFRKYFEDFLENGATFQNVAGMLSEFVGSIGDCLIMLGSFKVGGALKVVQGIGEICVAVKDIADSGVNWDNATTTIRGLTNIAIGISVFTGNLKVAAWGVAIQGFNSIISELAENWDAIKQGDWSSVNKVTLIIGGLEILGGLAVALDVFSKLKAVTGIGQAAQSVETVATATQTLDTTVSTSLSPKLTSLAKNLGLSIVIVAEVAAGTLLITGAIVLLGMELEQVGIAWQPVIDNGGTVAIAMGIGVGVLAGIGVVTALLGSVGTPLIVNIALGTAILAELGVAAGLFIVEVWAIGKGLDEIGKAWQPVLDSGETIAKGIGLGTALLVGIGVVTAALGAATVASAGLLPLAIGLGTALLVELAAAFILFTESLVAVADELSDNLSPSLEDLNGKLPGLSTNMSDFVDFMTEFAGHVVRYTEASAISGLAATIDTIIGWFTEDPIDKLAKDVANISSQTTSLNEKLRVAVPELQTAADLLQQYEDFLTEIETLTNSNHELSTGMFANMKEVGQMIVTGFVDGIKSKSSDFSNAAKKLINGFKTSLTQSAETCKSSIITWATNVKKWFTDKGFGDVSETSFQTYGKDIITGFSSGVTSNYSSCKSSITTWANNVKSWFSDIVSGSAFYNIGKDVISEFNSGINDFYDTSRPYVREWANDAKKTFKKELDSNSPSKVFMRIGEDTVLGYNIGIAESGKSTQGIMSKWFNSFAVDTPRLAFAVDTSALSYYNQGSFEKTMSAEVRSNHTVFSDGFSDTMEEFYRQYVEAKIDKLVEGVQRQADKEEQTIVQIGNRIVTDATVTQQKANGYSFIK